HQHHHAPQHRYRRSHDRHFPPGTWPFSRHDLMGETTEVTWDSQCGTWHHLRGETKQQRTQVGSVYDAVAVRVSPDAGDECAQRDTLRLGAEAGDDVCLTGHRELSFTPSNACRPSASRSQALPMPARR